MIYKIYHRQLCRGSIESGRTKSLLPPIKIYRLFLIVLLQIGRYLSIEILRLYIVWLEITYTIYHR